MEGRKNDAGKSAVDLIPWDVIGPMASDWSSLDQMTQRTAMDPHHYGWHLARWWRAGDNIALHDVFMSVCSLVAADQIEIEIAIADTVVPVLEFGARKYEPWNWSRGMKWSRLYAAALRHWLAELKGEQSDPETGLSHLRHLACCLMFLIVYEVEGMGEDDRPDHGPRKAA